MKSKVFIFSILLGIASISLSQTYTISGIIEDDQTRMPLKDATVTLPDKRSITTNSSGYFTIATSTRDLPLVLQFNHPEYLERKYKVKKARFNKNRELWLEIKLHPIDTSKVRVSKDNIGNPVVKAPGVNALDFEIIGDLLYVLIEDSQGFNHIQVYDLNDSLLAQQKVNMKYVNFYHRSRFECYMADDDYGCMTQVFFENGKITLGEEKCVQGFVYWLAGDAKIRGLILQQQDIYLPNTLRVFYLAPELMLDFDYYQLVYVASLNYYIARGNTGQYDSIRNECIKGKYANDMQSFIDSKIAKNNAYKDSIQQLIKFYVDTMYSDWFRIQASSIIYHSLDEAYQVRDRMFEYGYVYIPYCKPTFLEINNSYYIFNFTNMVLTQFDLNMNFMSTINLDPEYFSYFYQRDHDVITSYQNAYIVISRDELGVLQQVDLSSGSVIGQQELLRTVTSEHRVAVRNGKVYYISYYAYMTKNVYEEPLNIQSVPQIEKK